MEIDYGENVCHYLVLGDISQIWTSHDSPLLTFKNHVEIYLHLLEGRVLERESSISWFTP